MAQWMSDNFEWKKIRFSLKTQHSYAVPKKRTQTHNTLSFAVSSLAPLVTPRGFACNCRVAAAHRYCLHSSSTFQKKKNGSARKPTGQLACGADQLDPHFRAYAGRADPLCHP